ncbi:nucleotide disphospho-sugar-binding domain-containing protein [Nocardia vinacea]|uniref:glycosyltransferase n=1 Tax=Nocardia vinacea TaxID=96468 RepID=UPI0033DEAE68
MRFVFVPYSARGHVSPMLSVAAELVARGSQVRMIAGSGFRSPIEAAGVIPVVSPVDHEVRVPVGHGVGAIADRSRLWWRRVHAWRALAEVCAAELESGWPDTFVVDTHVWWAPGMITRRGGRVVPFWATHARLARGSRPVVVNALEELQPRRSRFGTNFTFVGPLVGGVTTADPGITWDRLAGRVLVVSPGTVFARPVRFFREVADAFAGTEWTVLMATAHVDPRELGALPANVFAHRWIPQLQLLRRADVLLTHGGMNSVHEAVLEGVPMLLTPRSREQRATASALRRLGLGEIVSGAEYLRGQADRLVSDPRVASRMARLRHRALARNGAIDAAELLLASARDGGGCDCSPRRS